MEVHTHTHPPASGHRRKWTHYLWEFLMLFLAVFCGFLAENQREHMVEHQREKFYIGKIIENLRDDTARIKRSILKLEKNIAGADSLIAFSRQRSSFSDSSSSRLLYHFIAYYLLSGSFFQSNDETLTQLRNAGGYRLIQKGHAADSIAANELAINGIYRAAGWLETSAGKCEDLMSELLDYRVFSDKEFRDSGLLRTENKLAVADDVQQLKVFFNRVAIVLRTENHYKKLLKSELKREERLISYLAHLYHIKTG